MGVVATGLGVLHEDASPQFEQLVYLPYHRDNVPRWLHNEAVERGMSVVKLPCLRHTRSKRRHRRLHALNKGGMEYGLDDACSGPVTAGVWG